MSDSSATLGTTVVLSDLHANARSLRAAIAAAEAGPLDRVVVLGDLLTYGADVQETLDLVDALRARVPTDIILGNHDELYLDMLAGNTAYYDTLPDWLRESVDWTLGQLEARNFSSDFLWQREVVRGDWLFAHAGPFGDYRYLNTDAQQTEAAHKLAERRLRLGVFGHTHRAGVFSYNSRTGASSRTTEMPLFWSRTTPVYAVINPGSVGQPRCSPPTTSFLRLTDDGETIGATVIPIDYDVAAHIASLRALPVSASTRDKLASFFVSRA